MDASLDEAIYDDPSREESDILVGPGPDSAEDGLFSDVDDRASVTHQSQDDGAHGEVLVGSGRAGVTIGPRTIELAEDDTDGPVKSPLPFVAALVSSLVVVLGMILATPRDVATIGVSDNAPVEAIEDEAQVDGESVDEQPVDSSGDSEYVYADDVLGVYETRATAGDEVVRSRNLQTAARALNGVILESNDDLSLNDVIGEPVAERGYEDVAGTEYAIDAIDQVASTLHVAALKSGLTVSERNPHMMRVDYVPLGMDAMVSWGGDDLVIHNGSSESMTIQATASGTTITISVLGVPEDPSLVYDVESLVTSTYSRPASEVYGDPIMQGLLSSDSVQFSTSETYLVTYRNGGQVSRSLLYSDTYQIPNPEVALDEAS